VVGVVGSSHKVNEAFRLGCDKVIGDLSFQVRIHRVSDKSQENLWEKAREYAPEGYDIVFDANGVETLSESFNHLSSGGKLVVYGMIYSDECIHPERFSFYVA
jgi:NADPH:quinone reductase-like Zn-dependent oxidoreductase